MRQMYDPLLQLVMLYYYYCRMFIYFIPIPNTNNQIHFKIQCLYAATLFSKVNTVVLNTFL